MSDEHDSWLQNAFGLDVGGAVQAIQDEVSAAATQVENTVTQAVQGLQGAAEGVIDTAVGAVSGAAKTVGGALGLGNGEGGGGGASSAGGDGDAGGGGEGSFPLKGSVGRGGKNQPGDVKAVQAALGITADGQCGGQTIAAIEAFQRNQGLPKADGRVDPGGATERALSAGGGGGVGADDAAGGPVGNGDVSGGDGDSEGGVFDRLMQGAQGLVDDATDLGGQVLKGAKELADDAMNLGGQLLAGAQGAASGILGDPGTLADKVDGAAGLDLTGKFHHELPETKFAEFPSESFVKGSLKYKSEITAEIVKGGKGGAAKFTGTTNQGAKIEVDIAKQKADDFSSETLRSVLKALKIKELKESLSCEISDKKVSIEFSITATIGGDSVEWVNGVAKGKFQLVNAEWEKLAKDPNDFALIGAGLEGGAQGQNVIPMDDIGIPGYGLKVQVTGVLSGSVSPNWSRILVEAGKEAGKKGAKEAAEQLVKGGEVAAIDVIVGVGLVLTAIAVVVGTAHGLAVAGELSELAGMVARARNEFEHGLGKGLQNEPSPGGGWLNVGWKAGDRVFQDALAKAKDKNPDKLPDEVRQIAINACVSATKAAEVRPEITKQVGKAFWINWVQGHHGVTTFRGEARRACEICFARPIGNDDPELQRWRDASDLPDALK